MSKKTLLCIVVAALSGGRAWGAITYEDVTRVDQGAIAYYEFNDTGTTAADAVGSNDGTYASGVMVNQATSPKPPAFGGFASTNVSSLLDASSSSSRVVLPTALNMSSAAGSVSMWINTSATHLTDSSGAGLFYGTSDTGGDGYGTQNELHLTIEPNKSLRLYGQGGLNLQTSGDAGVSDGTWHYVAATWDKAANKAAVYVDGNKVLSGSDGSNTFNFSQTLQLGQLGTAGNDLSRQYGGSMDEVALYNTALTDAQVHDQYNAAVNYYTGNDFVYQPDANGRITGEGELFSSRTDDGSGNGWRIVPTESAGAGPVATNARGGAYIQSLPDNGSGGGPTVPPSIEYKVKINTPGTYQLFLRWDGNATNSSTAGSSDSIFADVVEIKGAGTDWYEYTRTPDGNFATGDSNTAAWDGSGQAEVNVAGVSHGAATFNFTTAGVYTVRISQREDGSTLDSFVLQPQSMTAPTGTGPSRSKFMLQVEAEDYTRRSDNGTSQSWQLVDGTAGTGNLGVGENVGAGGKFANASNGLYMQVLPDSGASYTSAATALTGPDLEYQITVPVSGAYQLYAAWDGFNGNSDSMYASIAELVDGAGGQADWYRFSHGADANFATTPWQGVAGFEKTDAGGGDVRAIWNLVGGQTYTLRFLPREDGVALDAFRLVAVPEPTTLALLGLGALTLVRRRRGA